MRDELVTVATFDSDMDAALARQCLAGAGIKSFLADHSTVATAWHLTGALGGVKLQVASQDKDEATDVLAKAQAGELEVDVQQWSAGDDEDDDDEPVEPARSEREKTVDRATKSMVLSLLFLPLSLYTAWLLLDVATTEGELGPGHRRRAIFLGIGTAIAVGILLLFLRGTVRGMMHSR
jgi:hypothetical protein